MRNLKVASIITVFLVGMLTTNLMAQRRAENTRSAEAAYGYPGGPYKAKKKKIKKKKKQKQPKARKKGSSPAYRKKNPWAN